MIQKRLYKRNKVFTKKQITIPITKGTIKDKIVHLHLPVSFFIVNKVVKQGKWNIENNITQIIVAINNLIFFISRHPPLRTLSEYAFQTVVLSVP